MNGFERSFARLEDVNHRAASLLRAGMIFGRDMFFIAAQAQFTPKTVETKDERDKLTFRIRVKIDPQRLRARADEVRNGLLGVAYLWLDPVVAWPPPLQRNAAQ